MSETTSPVQAQRRRVREIGPELSEAAAQAIQALYAPEHAGAADPDVAVTRDLAYGGDARHRLDLFRLPAERDAPVLLFVHGGGFVAGDKRLAGTPFYDNVAVWAVRRGLVGVTMTHRLAPQHPWPAGAEDVAAAFAWLAGSVGSHGGDPARIVLMGHSAGAAHVAAFIADPRLREAAGVEPAGAILLSGVYDVRGSAHHPPASLYYGEDPARYGEMSSLAALARVRTPLFIGAAEDDLVLFRRQAEALYEAVRPACSPLTRRFELPGHNHLSEIFHLGGADEGLSHELLAFIRAVT